MNTLLIELVTLIATDDVIAHTNYQSTSLCIVFTAVREKKFITTMISE
jgi:hypothetical protein